MNNLKNQKKLVVSKYVYNEDIIKELKILIREKYSLLFKAVIVHGSIATDEVIPYSDFDGLLIVKEAFKNSKELDSFNRDSMKLILKFDPLQHHGWFQISEDDLLNYSEDYLPITVLEHSKLVYPELDSLELYLKVKNYTDFKSALIGMLSQFEKRNANNWRPKNMYQLKSELSQIMLLPCLYYSAINNKGIFKRESFEAVKLNFDNNEWMPIKVASNIRTDWNYSLSRIQRIALRIPNRRLRKIMTHFLSPKISNDVNELISEEFYSNLMLFIRKIRKDIL